MENNILIVDSSNFEIHYWFNDDTHLMDAFVQNVCEYEILGIIKEVSKLFKIEMKVETEPLETGGLRRLFKLTSKENDKRSTYKSQIIIPLLVAIISTPITKLEDKVFEKYFENSELKTLKKQKLKLEVEKLRQEIGYNIQSLDSNNVVKKKKSNFYELLEKYPKVDKVSYIFSDYNKEPLEEKTILRANFKEFILVTDELEPKDYDDIVIEIISPVLKNSNYKWMGIYKGESVPFTIKSKEFKDLVQSGQVQFKNGTSINCSLTIKKKIDKEGLEKITNIVVNRVNHYFQNDKPIETPEGRNHRRKKEAEKQQLNLFVSKDITNR